MPFLSLPLLLLLASPLLASAASNTSTPQVSLLIDSINPLPNNSIASLVSQINDRKLKNGTFYFGSTLASLDLYPETTAWTEERFNDTWNLAVAENDCKMFSWYVAPGTVNASRCAVLRDWAADRGVAFRGHNTFWHSQRPDWLTDNSSISVQDLNETVIPYGVSTIIKQMGPSLISWDVVNEPWSDTASLSSNAQECVLNASRWPNYLNDGFSNSTQLFPDTSFINTALIAADQARTALGLTSKEMGLFINDYNISGSSPLPAKTECAFKGLESLLAQGVPLDGLGIQSHLAAVPNQFPSKADAHFTYDRLAKMGLVGAITELDIWVPDNSTEAFRYQAAIYGDVIDACLYSPNCFELVAWDNRDDQSWLDSVPFRGQAQGTLFDRSGNPKLAYYEVQARFQRFVDGLPEPCATSDGVDKCVLQGYE